jgi:hypothetical protein
VASAILSTHTLPGSALPTEDAYAATFAFSAAAALLALVATLLIPRAGSSRAVQLPDGAVEPAVA